MNMFDFSDWVYQIREKPATTSYSESGWQLNSMKAKALGESEPEYPSFGGFNTSNPDAGLRFQMLYIYIFTIV